MKTPAEAIASYKRRIIEAENDNVTALPKRANEYVKDLIAKYNLAEADSMGNADATWRGPIDEDVEVNIQGFGSTRVTQDVLFDAWYMVELAFGEPYHDPNSRGMGIVGSKGYAVATSRFETRQQIERRVQTGAMTGILGHDIVGLKWRIGLFYPMSRVPLGIDMYVKADDIIEYLARMRSKIPADKAPMQADSSWVEGWR